MAQESHQPSGQPVRGVVDAKGGERRGRAVLYGLGRDGDGHIRITTGPGFCLTGGTDGTHQAMGEYAERIMAEVARRGYSLNDLTRDQAEEVAWLVESFRPENA